MTGALDFTTPREAHRAMLDAGAVFTVRRRDDTLGLSFTYSVAAGGDALRCRQIIGTVKTKPAPFFAGFKTQVQDAVERARRGAA